ncbi:MAG TPA: iron transporter [Candidatus Baltobacteraceae bacterium]
MQNTELEAKSGKPAHDGTEKMTSGDYDISYRIEPAKGLYEFSAGKLEWKEPSDENVHLDLLVHDARDGRFIPGLHIVATLIDGKGGQAASNHLPFVWHPQENHYGSNVKVPQSGEYLLQVHIYPATFVRADKEQGKRFIADVHVSFENVRIDV